MKNQPTRGKVTLESLADMMNSGFADLRTDIANVEEKIDGVAEKLNDVTDRVSRLMTKEEAISLFDMATLKVEHDHMKKIIRDKLHVEV